MIDQIAVYVDKASYRSPHEVLRADVLASPSRATLTQLGQLNSQTNPNLEIALCGSLYKHSQVFENNMGGRLHIECADTLTGMFVYVLVDAIPFARSTLHFPLCEALIY